MSHQQIIQTLIEWIDEHIDQPLNIDVVAKAEDNPTHDNCVNYLYDELNDKNIEAVKFSTYVFAEDRTYEEQ
ncbi:hypothetical protein MJL33_33090, partial [Salmonella enterica subsp. enterica serovar Kentucky]|nr:hypothetical protein [Salmonella enterica subsp. enterica serovar Kentucky]